MVDAAEDTTCKVMVVGLQGCGKTTFAAALWHLVSSDEVENLAMKIGKHSGNFAYLDRIARLWADGYRVGRTEHEAEDKVEIDLVDASTGRGCVLSFTDMAGERFEETFATRACPMSVIERIDEADGLLLFVSAWRRPTDGSILKAIADVPALAPSPADVAKAPTASNWKPADTPPEAMLVDLLDAFTRPPFERCPKRLAVVVSAWDLVRAGSGGDDIPTPEGWLDATYPLLRQYLSASEHGYDVRCYGISAQGADAPEQGDGPHDPRRKELLKHAKPSNRIAVVGSGAGSHDLTAPLKWLSTGGD